MKNKSYFIVIFLVVNSINGFSQNISKLYKKVNPSVVTILTESKNLQSNYQMSTDAGLGSGVLISDSGEILTAAHVVNNAERVQVKFVNGEEILAKVIQSAPTADIALIKLSWMPEEYTVAKIGDSDKISVGEQVFVVGAPFGLEHSLSVGYISRREKPKTRTSGFRRTEFFQTDAAINQGNSGGPMFNLKGEVVGISSYIISKSGGFQGLGFAVTSNLAKELVIDGNRRWTGIQGNILDKLSAWMLNSPIEGGMLVESVVKFSPADIAGLRGGFQKAYIEGKEVILGGDIILSVNGVSLTEKELKHISSESGNAKFLNTKTYNLKVLRGGNIQDIKIEFDE